MYTSIEFATPQPDHETTASRTAVILISSREHNAWRHVRPAIFGWSGKGLFCGGPARWAWTERSGGFVCETQAVHRDGGPVVLCLETTATFVITLASRFRHVNKKLGADSEHMLATWHCRKRPVAVT